MKRPKRWIVNSLALAVLVIVSIFPLVGFAVASQAPAPDLIPFQPAIAGLDLTGCNAVTDRGNFLGCYISSLYTFLVQAAVILAVLMTIIGGFQYLLALGNTSRIEDAKETIKVAIIGLVLALTSYLLFNLINTKITDVANLDIMQIDIKPTATSTPALPDRIGSCNFPAAQWQTLYKLNLNGLRAAERQTSTAHPELVQALQRLDTELQAPNNSHVIASISSITDGNIFLGDCRRKDDGMLTSDCQHSDSWHYGGPQNRCFFDRDHPPISCAVDITSAAQSGYVTLEQLMKKTGSGFTFVQCENNTNTVACSSGTADHIHGQIDRCASLLTQ